MKIIEIAPLDNGAHRNQSYPGFVPDDWAVVPDNMECENFPFGEVETAEIDGVMTVTKWIPGVIPESNVVIERTVEDDRDTMMIDHEYRLTLLELGVY